MLYFHLLPNAFDSLAHLIAFGSLLKPLQESVFLFFVFATPFYNAHPASRNFQVIALAHLKPIDFFLQFAMLFLMLPLILHFVTSLILISSIILLVFHIILVLTIITLGF